MKVWHVRGDPDPRCAWKEVPGWHGLAMRVQHIRFLIGRIDWLMQISRLLEVEFSRHTFSGRNLPLHAPCTKFMCSSSSWSWPAVDSIHNHAENVADISMVSCGIAESLEGDLVSNACLFSMKESEKIKWQEAFMIRFVDVVSS